MLARNDKANFQPTLNQGIGKVQVSLFLRLIVSKIIKKFEKGFLTLFRIGFFGAAHRWGEGVQKGPLPKTCHTYPAMTKLDTVIPYPKEIQKLYESRDTPCDFC